ncbi:hypothetical protein MHBO_003933, partial [Bonamia ostreae]
NTKMNIIKEIEKINKKELRLNTPESASWHAAYKNSSYVFVSGIDYQFSEGDIICIFSQFGEIVDCNLVKDKEKGNSLGYAFVAFEDQRSTVLAVDNFNGTKINGRILRCDHVKKYRRPTRKFKNEENSSSAQEGQSDEEYESRRKLIWDPSKFTIKENRKKKDKIDKKTKNKQKIDKIDK